MIYTANHRDNVEKGDPKVGGHASASSSALHILGALHLVVKSGFDHIANKPHASPTDHSYNYLLNLLLDKELQRFSKEDADQAMSGLRAFSQNGEPVFQSYHSAWDPDHHNFFPSGTVGIPPVMAGYLALAYTYAKKHGFEVPDAHFWAVMGDSEFREGSLHEAVPEFAERQIGNLTWILDYNRQSLDGHRISNRKIMAGTDDLRVQRSMEANGWHVLQVKHGKLREKLFSQKGGEHFKALFDDIMDDYDLQVLLQIKDVKDAKEFLLQKSKKVEDFLKSVDSKDLMAAIRDFGGHDFEKLVEAMEKSKAITDQPTFIIVHTLKGWGLDMAASPGNHSTLPEESEIQALAKATGLKDGQKFEGFEASSAEGKYLKTRGDQLYKEICDQHALKEKNKEKFLNELNSLGEMPESLDINFKMANYPHTQWMLGQLTSKLSRIANTPLEEKMLSKGEKALKENEIPFKQAGEMIVAMAPDVGTSTNMNPSMDGKIFSALDIEDEESEFGVKDKKQPDLVPGEEITDRFLRFEITEANTMSCKGSFGQMRDLLGIPLLPVMTVYDFFIKRALDQLFYNLYWKSSFILVGTPSGVTLSPEGAQHGWKSDIQIPNQITWEPFFCQELDWILVDSIRRHFTYDNEGRSGVIIRGVTRGADQKEFLKRLKRHQKFKQDSNVSLCHPEFEMDGAHNTDDVESFDENQLMAAVREDVLKGGYFLVDYRGFKGYEPGDNVVHIFSMGAPTAEALAASDALLAKGIYANVILVTSPDLLIGNLGHLNDYEHLKHGLNINSELYLQPQLNGSLHAAEVKTVAGRRIPIVSVHDGEMGLLDNIGSIVGVKHEALGVRKHSKCGRPSDVYRYHGIDDASIVEACEKVLQDTSLETVQISKRVLEEVHADTSSSSYERQHSNY
ncbi:MAG: pyruvate dehydrogenase [Bdellovibrionaceae bacterium]|nr:pyruvate dehydrogenase [Pseudobdellovibrionaceae bacterium]